MLEGLGWRLHRIWGLSWWRDRENQVGMLKAAIESAITDAAPAHEVYVTSAGGSAALDAVELDFGSSETEEDTDPVVPGVPLAEDAPECEALPEWVQPYRFAEIAPSVRGDKSYSAFLGALLDEAPVSENRMLQILKASLGVARVNPEQTAQLLAEIDRDPRFARDERGFICAVGRPINAFRQPHRSDLRTVVPEISDPELKFAVLRLVEDHLLIHREHLIQEVVRFAGDLQVTRPARRIIDRVIDQCHVDGSLTIDDDGTIS